MMISITEAINILETNNCSKEVINHSLEVSKQALYITNKYLINNQNVNSYIVEIGSLLHDLGKCTSYGIDHAIIGSKIAKKYNIEKPIINVIKKHIGSGIDIEEAKKYNLPEDNYMPITNEEKIVAYADNLINGTIKISFDKRIKILKEKNIYSNKIYNRYIELHNEIKIKALL